MPEFVVGSTVAGCRLDAIAGRGGMGVVWRATQVALHRPVAIKAIAPGLAEDQAFRDRFERESLLAASIDHPNVIPVYEAGELDGTLYLIMRWVDGTDLRARLMSEGGMPPEKAVRLLRPVASALSAAHRRGLIHRDIKPANVLIARGDDAADEHVYLTDFGIARRNDSRGMTRTGVLIGTIDYIAPEMIQGERGTQASDIYGFGCMLFETLTGHVPFARGTDLAKMHAHLNDPIPADEVPPALMPIVTRAMAKRPEDRYGSAAELVTALDALGTGSGTASTAPIVDEPQPTVLRSSVPGALTEDATVLEKPTTLEKKPTSVDQPAAPPARAAATPSPSPPASPQPPRSPSPPSPSPPPATPSPSPAAATQPPRRRGLVMALALLALVAIAVIVLVTTSGGGASTSVSAQATGSGVEARTPRPLRPEPFALGPDVGAAWAATRNQLIQLTAGGGTQIIHEQGYSGPATALAVDARSRLWLTGIGARDGVHVQGNVVEAGQGTNLLTLDSHAAWVGTRGASTVVRVDLQALTSTAAAVTGPIAAYTSALARLWLAASDGHVTVLNDADGHRDALPAPDVAPGTVGVASSNGIWFVSSDGRLDRMDPRTTLPAVKSEGHYVLHAVSAHVDGGASAAGTWPNTNAIWVLSPGSKSLVRIGTQGDGKITARVTFSATPGHLAVGDHVVWVDFPDTHEVIPITYR